MTRVEDLGRLPFELPCACVITHFRAARKHTHTQLIRAHKRAQLSHAHVHTHTHAPNRWRRVREK